MLEVADRRVHIALAHAHGGEAGLQADIVRREGLGPLEVDDRIGQPVGRRIGAPQKIVCLRIGFARFGDPRQGIDDQIRAALDEQDASQNLVAREIVRRRGQILASGGFRFLELTELFLHHGAQEISARDAPQERLNPLQIVVGGFIILRLSLDHRVEVQRLDIALATLQDHIYVGTSQLEFPRRQCQIGTIQAGLRAARLVGDQRVEHRHRTHRIALEPQQLRLGQQSLGRFRLGDDRTIDLLLGTLQIVTGNRQAGIGQKRFHGIGCRRFGVGEGFLRVLGTTKIDLGVTARNKDRGIQRAVLALGLQSLQHFVVLVLAQQRLRQQRGRLMGVVAPLERGGGFAFGGHGIAEFDLDAAEQEMGLGVLGIAAHRVPQIDLRGFQVALLQVGPGVRQVIGVRRDRP